jgi:acetyl-CoA C-acetyltransferase
MKDVFIVGAKRTPMGSFGGALSGFSAPQLGSIAIKSALEQAGVDKEWIEEVYLGNVCQANVGQAPARQAAMGAGLSHKVPATTVNKVCASGLKAVSLAAQSLQLGQADWMIAGGMESMSNIPYYLEGNRWGQKYGHGTVLDGLQKDGLTDVYQGQAMGCFGDATALAKEISREEQDRYAIQSYQRAAAATDSGDFAQEMAAVEIPQRKGDALQMVKDEEYTKVMFDKIPTLRPVFTKEGSITAANASTINDGASALVLCSSEAMKAKGLKPLARIVAYADAAHEPQWFTTAPISAAHKALERAGLTIGDIDYFEVNEAFAVVALAFIKEFGLSEDRVNIAGGAVALGHPLGSSGSRILVTLTHALQRKSARYGMAAICNGGGGATAMIIERM